MAISHGVVRVLVSSLLMGSALFAQDPNYVISASEESGTVGGQETVSIFLDFPAGDALTGYTLAVCHDATLMTLTSAEDGPPLVPSTLAFNESSVYTNGYTVAVLFDFFGVVVLPPGSGYELKRGNYDLLAEGTASVDLCDDFLGAPPVDIVVTTTTLTINPTLVSGSVEIGTVPGLQLQAEEKVAAPGEVVSVEITLDSLIPVGAFSIGVSHDSAVVQLDAVELGDAVLDLDGGAGPDYFFTSTGAGGVVDGGVVGVLVSKQAPFATLQPGADLHLATFHYTVLSTAADGSSSALAFTGGVGSPPVALVFAQLGQARFPVAVDGSITVSGDPPPVGVDFLRGDVNADGVVEALTDAPAVLGYASGVGVKPSCLKAADANDDGLVGIDDGIYLLNQAFSGGDDPPAPFGACGPDPTPDSLSCTTYTPCP